LQYSIDPIEMRQSHVETMKNFEAYVLELETIAALALSGKNSKIEDLNLKQYLNGNVGTELRRRVPLDYRQRIGAFFTSEALRTLTISTSFLKTHNGLVWDPACGAGDLLLRVAEVLPATVDLASTLNAWGNQLCGNDIEPVFVRAAKARLVLAAYLRGARRQPGGRLSLTKVFPLIRVGDSLVHPPSFKPTRIVLNPPFIAIKQQIEQGWGAGSVSAAAVFIDQCLKIAVPGALISAILPDVLRTGSRYERWRAAVQKKAEVTRLEVYGAFDPQADVDVFVVELRVRSLDQALTIGAEPWGICKTSASATLGHYCTVAVGPVVPHRHKNEGLDLPYLHAKDAPQWGVIENITARRQFAGTTFQPPFVVIRRTSSPSDKFRAVGTLVACNEPVAVENHLIICSPNDGSLATCVKIMEVLHAKTTNEWLNGRIRCRHLTVGSVKDIPWVGYKKNRVT
jgi:hypothetical protein